MFKAIKSFTVCVLTGVAMSATVSAEQFDFSDKDEYQHWYPITDRVMGGRSISNFFQDNGNAVFSGTLSLANNGGFALARRYPVRVDMFDAQAMTLITKGDGRRYQIRLGVDGRRSGVSYTAFFNTSKDQWQTHYFEISDFTPMYRGRILDLPKLNRFDPVRQVGIMISDKISGPFSLTIANMEIGDNQQL